MWFPLASESFPPSKVSMTGMGVDALGSLSWKGGVDEMESVSEISELALEFGVPTKSCIGEGGLLRRPLG